MKFLIGIINCLHWWHILTVIYLPPPPPPYIVFLHYINECPSGGLPKWKCSPKNRIWWLEFWGWYWIQYNILMTFFLIEFLEYVLIDGSWIGHLAAQNSCILWWTHKVKISTKTEYVDRISGLILNTIQHIDDLFANRILGISPYMVSR